MKLNRFHHNKGKPQNALARTSPLCKLVQSHQSLVPAKSHSAPETLSPPYFIQTRNMDVPTDLFASEGRSRLKLNILPPLMHQMRTIFNLKLDQGPHTYTGRRRGAGH